MGNKVLIDEDNLNNIALAIQSKTGSSEKVTPSEMATAIEGLPSGGMDTQLKITSSTKYISINETDELLVSSSLMKAYRNSQVVKLTPSTFTKFKWVTRTQINAIPSANTWLSFFGNNSRKLPRVYFVRINGDNSNVVVMLEIENSSSTRIHANVTVPLNTWVYISLTYDTSIDGYMRLKLYDDTGTLIATGVTDSAVGTLDSNVYELDIGSTDGTSAMTFNNGIIDFGQTFFEVNGSVVWGNKGADI